MRVKQIPHISALQKSLADKRPERLVLKNKNTEGQCAANDSYSAGNLPLSDSNEEYYSRTYLDGTLKDVKEVLEVIQAEECESPARTPVTLHSKSKSLNYNAGGSTQ